MDRYRDGWVLVAAVTATVGAWTALQTWPLVAVIGTFATAAFVGSSIAGSTLPEWRRKRLGPVAAAGALAGIAVVAGAGLIDLLGAPALLVLGVLAAACPRLWVALRSWRPPQQPRPSLAARPPEPPETAPATPYKKSELTLEVPPEPWLLDDRALCSAWRRSYLVLERHHSPETHLRVVQQRQLYLDELERRNPQGLAAWLASGARAAGDPTRFIVPR